MITDDYIINKAGMVKRSVSDLKNWNEYNGAPPDDIPSFHPYWTVQVLLSDVKQYEKHSKQLIECIDNPDNIKFLYNSTSSIEQIKVMVSKYKESVEILKYLNIIPA